MTTLKGQAQTVAEQLVHSFENGTAPKALAHIFITKGEEQYCSSWSFMNRLIVALGGFSDARTYNGWVSVGRQVRKGEKAFYILEPLRIKKKDGEEERVITVGFKGGARFGLEQTDGEPYDLVDQEHIDSLPLLHLADKWDIQVTTYQGEEGKAAGFYAGTGVIALGVQNLSTWAHELVHAADDKLGNLKERGQHVDSETVAELGGCILLHMLGHHDQADDGGAFEYIQHYATSAGLDTLDAIARVVDRTCQAVTLILEEARVRSEEREVEYA